MLNTKPQRQCHLTILVLGLTYIETSGIVSWQESRTLYCLCVLSSLTLCIYAETGSSVLLKGS